MVPCVGLVVKRPFECLPPWTCSDGTEGRRRHNLVHNTKLEFIPNLIDSLCFSMEEPVPSQLLLGPMLGFIPSILLD